MTSAALSTATEAPASRARDHLALAVDVESVVEAEALVRLVGEEVGVVKIGLELFTRFGPEAVRAVAGQGRRVFLDLKLHDIPETVARAVRSVGALGVDLLTVHAAGGGEMLRRACDAAPAHLSIVAVTVLTSLDDTDLRDTGVDATPSAQAARLAALAFEAGVKGLVCSAEEVERVRATARDALLVTPGIRPAGAARGDQKRTLSPREAIAKGADLLVVGRPIRDAVDPMRAARAIVADIALGLQDRTRPEGA